MINILKAEFNKLIKGKAIYILLIATIILPFLTAGLYKIVSVIDDSGILQESLSTFELFKQSFNPLNNIGLLLLITIIVIISTDFSNNTIRNKIVGGYSKTQVYLSSLIITLILSFIYMTIYTILTVLLSGVFINFSNNTFKQYFYIYIVNMSSLFTIYTIINFFLFIFKSFGKTLGITLALLFTILIVYSIFSFTINENTNKIIVTILPILNIFYSKLFSLGRTISIVLINIIYIITITTLGIYLNKKSDYK